MNYLRPCPFCGGKAILEHDLTGLGASYIRCEKCGLESVRFIKSFERSSDREVIKYWNRRNVAEVVHCKDCKYHKNTSVPEYKHCCMINKTVWHNAFCYYGESIMEGEDNGSNSN